MLAPANAEVSYPGSGYTQADPVAENCHGRHAVQFEASAETELPAAHVAHDVAPTVLEYVPATQSWHCELAVVFANLPITQLLHPLYIKPE